VRALVGLLGPVGIVSCANVEASNNKFKLTIRKAFGFRSFEVLRVAVLHQLGDLPEPQFAHRFW